MVSHKINYESPLSPDVPAGTSTSLKLLECTGSHRFCPCIIWGLQVLGVVGFLDCTWEWEAAHFVHQ